MHELSNHLQVGWQAFNQGIALLKDCEPDSIQVELYELAFSYAELLACEQLLRFLDSKSSNSASYRYKFLLARSYLAQTLTNLKTRLCLLQDHQGDSPPIEFGAATTQFALRATAPSAQVELANELMQHQGRLPNSELKEEVESMRDTVRKFTDDVVVPQAEDIHRNDWMIPADIIAGVRELGCFALSVPERYGGMKPDQGENTEGMVVITEELSRGSLGAAGSLITRPEIMVRALLEGGTETQRQRWLPMIASGEQLCAVSVTEPDTGSDVAAVKLQATRCDDGWLLNGEKTWCTFAGKAELILVLARTDSQVVPPHRGLSLFVVEKPASDEHHFNLTTANGGTLTARAIPTLGYRGMHSFTLFFDNFLVPNSNLVGEESGMNRGFYYTMRGFSGGRLQTAARATGLMQAAYDSAFQYAQDRHVFGKPVASFQLSQAKFARMATYIVAVKQFSYHVAALMDQEAGQLEASLVKLIACKYAESVAREALQIHGGMGYAEETNVSRYFVDAKVLSIFEGAEETLALRVVGKALLDLAKQS